MADLEELAGQLTDQQVFELMQIRDDDRGYLARGDQAGLSAIGLAEPPRGQGSYRLTILGMQVRASLPAFQRARSRTQGNPNA